MSLKNRLQFLGAAVLLLFLAISNLCHGQDVAGLHDGKRLAMVIGVSNYDPPNYLKNPVNDATDMAAILTKLGFNVTICLDPNKKQLVDTINSWGHKLDTATVGVFYFAGHGAEYNSDNYIFAKDSHPQNSEDLPFETYPVNRLLGKIKDARTKAGIILLDACRDNPFVRGWTRGFNEPVGLANVSAPVGSFIGFAAAPGSLSSDGTGKNGIYTAAVLKYLATANLTIDQVFKKINNEVNKNTNRKQIPWENTSMTEDFYFVQDFETSIIKVPVNPIDKGSPARDTSISILPNNVPSAIDLSKFVGAVRNQGPEGSAVGFSIADLVAGTYNFSKHDSLVLSPRFVYNSLNNKEDRGVFLADGLRFAENVGVVPEKYWKYVPGKYDEKPPPDIANVPHYKISSFEKLEINAVDFRNQIGGNRIILIGMPVYEEYFKVGKEGVLPTPNSEFKYQGLISALVVGYDDAKRLFKIRLSWGSFFGDNGYVYCNYSDIAKFAEEAYVVGKVF